MSIPNSTINSGFEMPIPNSTINSGIDSDNALVSHNNSRHSFLQPYTNQAISRKSMICIDVPFIPEEIIYKILLLLPAKLLHDVMRTVCRLWKKVICDPDFIKAHRSRSTIFPFCIFFHDDKFEIYSLKADEITWEFNKTITGQTYLTRGDGFILTRSHYEPWNLFLVNPLTKKIISLPRFHKHFYPQSGNCTVSSSPLTLKCKVVILRWPEPEFYILTIGEDKEWKEVVGPDLRLDSSLQLHTIVHQGLICWYDRHNLNYLISLDVENEVFHKVVIPKEVPMGMWERCSGTSLVVNYCSTAVCREFWELVDCKNGGEWRKFGIVNFESHKPEIIEIMGVDTSFHIDGSNFRAIMILSRDVVIFYHEAPV